MGGRAVAYSLILVGVVAAGLLVIGAVILLVVVIRLASNRHQRPARIHLAHSLPSTPTGKVRPDALRAMAAS